MGRAAVPSGASTGAHEAVELRDGDKSRYGGKGVLKAVESVNARHFRRRLRLRSRRADQDRRGDDRARRHAQQGASSAPTPFSASRSRSPRRRRRPRACRSTAMSAARRRACCRLPMMNIVNGGVHADNPIDFQEFMILPLGAPSLREAVRWGAEMFHTLKGAAQEGRPQHQCRRRGRLCAQSALRRSGARLLRQGDRERRLQARRRHRARPRLRRDRVLQGRRLCLWRRRQDALDRGAGRAISPSSPTTIRSSRSRTACRRTIGTAGSC